MLTMQYHGPLFGHVPGTRKYFDTGKTSEDWDVMVADLDKLRAALHQCLAATGEEAGDIDDFRALEDRETITVDAVRQMRRELDQARQTIEDIATGARLECPTCGKPRPCCCNDLGETK